MTVPFTKAHGARNDFLLTWVSQAPTADRATIARAICDRNTGIGADGWIVVSPGRPGSGTHGVIHLYNSDGSEAEISGNGTRCAAAFLLDAGVETEEVLIETGAGVKRLRVLEHRECFFQFEMGMGRVGFPHGNPLRLATSRGEVEVTVMDAGNPQCALRVDDFDFDWRGLGAELERHSFFPNRTNVSLYRPVDRHTLEARFFERGAGETWSSGTGSTGAAAAAIRLELVESPVTVLTAAGPLAIRLEAEDFYLTGPAQIVGGGEYYA